MQLTLTYGQKETSYSVLFTERKSLQISVTPDCVVIVKAPKNTTKNVVEQKVESKARWIFKQLRYFNQFQPRTPSRSYIGGETHLYLGKQYRLKVAQGTENSVKLAKGYFFITTKNSPEPFTVKRLLNKWYRTKAEKHFIESLEICWKLFEFRGVGKPKLSIKTLEKRWGSLSETGTLTLNLNLIQAPKDCIDYVITHELCHLIHHNHSPEFYNLLDSVWPNWEQIKQKLELKLS